MLNVHLDQLAYLREVARCRSWSEAAANLHMSQPALSQSLRELERRLGTPLFEKHGRRQRLTATGDEVVAFAHRVLSQAEAFSGRLEAMQRGRAGRLRVGMIDAACLYALPVALRTFQQERPDVDLHLTVAGSGWLVRQLFAFDLDLAVVVGPVDSDAAEVIPILDEPLFMYRPADGGGAPEDASWVLYPSYSHTRELINNAFSRRGLAPHIALESGNPQVLRQMVAMGFGWSVLPESVAAEQGSGITRVDTEPLLRRPIVAVRRRGAPADPRVERLLELALA